MSLLKVNTIRHSSASSDAITLASDGTATAKITNNLSNRNLIINGAMQVWQRGTSSNLVGYRTADRFKTVFSGTNEDPTRSKLDLTSSDTGPWAKGFRTAYRITNGNQTSVEAGDFIKTEYHIEAQDLANSGWDYTSASSKITLSFWVRSSIAQTFYTQLKSEDGTNKMYYFSYTLSANTWAKVTHTIPGHADLTFDNNNGAGAYIAFYQYRGTNNTGTVTANQWNAYDASILTADQTDTWYDTNDATWDLTGVQLEIGDTVTDFEHRSYGDELARCQRYYETSYPSGYSPAHDFNETYPFNTSKPVAQNYVASDDTLSAVSYPFMVNKRASPTVTIYSANDGASGNAHTYKGTGGTNLNVALNVIQTREQQMMLGCSLGATGEANEMYFHYTASSEL